MSVQVKIFAGKTAVVTGGAKGIGAATARYFATNGAAVAILDTDFAAGKALAESLQITFYFTDVSRETEVQQTFAAIQTDLGRTDILVNNAAIQRYSTVTDTTEAEWDLVMNVNLKSAFLCAKYAIPQMQAKGEGVIVNVSSVQAFMSQANVAPYTTAKTALLGLTRSIAVDYAPLIRCNAVCPGAVDTPMLRHDLSQMPNQQAALQECMNMALTKTIGNPDDVAALIGFVCSPNGRFMTGQAIRIDGGLGVNIPSEI